MFALQYFRTATIECLTEIASLSPSDIPDVYKESMQKLLVHFIQQLSIILPRETNLAAAYEDGTEEERAFISRLALFFCTYLKSYLSLFDLPNGAVAEEAIVYESLVYMVRVSEVEDEEIFKTCLDFWVYFSKELYNADSQWKISPASNVNNQTNINRLNNLHPKHLLFDAILHSLRILMIDRMAKPEEVIIVEDDNGQIVREMTKDTEVIAQYKLMREIIVYLTNLSCEDSEAIMLEKLDLQVAGGMFSWNGLNTLCWAIGSISGAMSELDEKRFLVSVIKDLLRLCEEQRGKDNKAVVASNIMYIVGQYPRFLRAHWKFLKTVVNKLFEFMHEHHPGVQDMACDTFLKIAEKCKRKFMTPQVEDPQPFILTLINDLQKHIADLQPHQVQSFYESVGTMLSDQSPILRIPRDEVVLRLMESQNAAWKARMAEGQQNVQSLLQVEVMKELSKILRINIRVCSTAGTIYIHQLSSIFMDVLNVYRLYSEQIIAACAQQGPIAMRYSLYKTMRGVKSDILDLFIAFVEACRDSAPDKEVFVAQFMPSIVPQILTDFHTSPPAARAVKVLSFFTTSIIVLKDLVAQDIPRIMDAIFEKTLEMISTNMLDYPEHRIEFFKFLHEANQHCFQALFTIPSHYQKLVIDSIVWAFKHTERNISETGLEILLALLENLAANPQVAQPFYVTFLVSLIHDVLGVMTDRLHKSGFKLHASILKHLFHTIQSGQVVAPLHALNGMDNAQFVREDVCVFLITAFPNLTKSQIMAFVGGLFDTNMDLNAFKQHLRDFLIANKEFESEDNSELYIEEAEAALALNRQAEWEYMASVPGLLKPADIENEA